MRMTWLFGMTAMFSTACGGSNPKDPKEGGMGGGMGGMGAMKMEAADPAADTQAILATVKGYESWPRFAEMQQPTRSEGHMNMYVLAFHNQVVADAIKAHTLPLPEGAIIVKQEMMKPDATPMSITVMSKQGGAWHYVKASPDGMKVMTMNGMALAGREVGMCKDCHGGAADNDYVLTHKFK